MNEPRPPQAAAWLLQSLVPPGDRPLLAEIRQLFQSRAHLHGLAAARRWYWWVAVTAPPRLWLAALSRRADPGAPPAWPAGLTHGLGRDLRLALRGLRRTPGFSALVVLTLGVGIAAATAIFAVTDAVLLRPLPYAEPDRLVRIVPLRDGSPLPVAGVSALDLEDWLARTSVFAGAALYRYRGDAITGGPEPIHVDGAPVSDEFFQVLGVEPTLGRLLGPGDAADGASVVVLGYGLWRRVFGGDPSVVGRTIHLDGTPTTVVGVGPAEFTISFPERGIPEHEIWVPIRDRPAPRDHDVYWALARLAEGVTLKRARADLRAAAAGLASEYPDTNRRRGLTVVPLHDWQTREARTTLRVLLASAGLLLLIGVANVSSLLLTRARSRAAEMAISVALGARRWHTGRRLLLESLVLSAVGGAVALALTVLVSDALARALASAVPLATRMQVDWRVWAFAASASVGTGALATLSPLWRRDDAPAQVLRRAAGRGATDATGAGSALVAAEVALGFVLLVGAALLAETLWHLDRVEPGVNRSVLTARVRPRGRGGSSQAFYARVHERLASLPGVRGVASANYGLMSGRMIEGLFQGAAAADGASAGDPVRGVIRVVSPGYFEVMGIRLLEGRTFSADDEASGRPVVIVNEALRRRLGATEGVTGQWLHTGTTHPPSPIVGVVSEVKHGSLDEDEVPIAYLTFSQIGRWNRTLFIAAAGDPLSLVPSVRAEIRALDPDAPVIDVATMDQVIAATLGPERLRSVTLAAFAGAAFLLVVIGVYGVVSQTVTQRRRDMAIRLALGASAGRVRRQVVGQALRTVAMGVVLGAAAAIPASRALAGVLYAVAPGDPMTLGGAATVILVSGILAAWWPATRAGRVEAVGLLSEA